MNPETTQPAQGGVAQPQSQGQSLDPSVVALTKSIGQKESSNFGTPAAYNNVGDGGNSLGAYQMSKQFISEYAPKVLGSSYQGGDNLTPAQQDELAYGVIKEWGTTGDPNYSYLGKLSPAQIASAWNSGDPNAYTEAGYGDKQEPGGVPNYVSTVEENYNKLNPQAAQSSSSIVPTANASGGSTNQSSSSASTPSWEDVLLGSAAGVGSWLLGKAVQYGTKPAEDAAIDATIGAVGGPEGAAAGAVGGVVQGIVQDATGGSGGNNQPPTDTSTAASAPQPDGTPNIEAEGNQVSPNKVTPPPAQPVQQNENQQSSQASQSIVNGVQQMMGSTISGRKGLSDPNVQGGIEEMGMNGYAPEIDENGVANFEGAIEQSGDDIRGIHEAIAPMLAASGGIAPTQEAVQDAIKDFNQKKGYTESDRAEAAKAIQEEADSYTKSYGDGQGNMSLAHFDKMRSETGHGRKWNQNESNAKREALKSLSSASRRTVEKHSSKEVKDLYNRAMKKQQRIINARNVMKKLDKKKAPPHKSAFKSALNAAGKYASLYIGDKIGGPLGAILGSMVGDYVTRAADKKFGKSVFETPAMHKGLDELRKKAPKAYSVLERELKKAGIRTPRLALPAPSTIYGQPYKGGESKGVVVQSKTPPKDFATAERMKRGGSQYGGLYEKNKEIEASKKAALRGLINLSPKRKG